jgi:ANTAR domain
MPDVRAPRLNGDQSMRIALAFARETAQSPTARLCTACVEVLEVSGAGITIMDGDQAGPICVSDSSVAVLEDLQFTVGQGPCRDAYRSGSFVHAPRLDGSAFSRWPPFVDLARSSGIGAVFAYPLLSHSVNVGVLTLYQQTEGELSAAQHDDSLALATVLTATVLSLQDAAPVGVLAPELEEAVAYRAEIHQASGMVAVQLGITPSEALLRIRGHAFAHGLPVRSVATEIVARRLRLDDDRPDMEPKE